MMDASQFNASKISYQTVIAIQPYAELQHHFLQIPPAQTIARIPAHIQPQLGLTGRDTICTGIGGSYGMLALESDDIVRGPMIAPALIFVILPHIVLRNQNS